MRANLFALLLALLPIVFYNTVIAGRCSGGPNCTACTNCSSCKNCSEQGGTCSVCTNYDEPEPQQEYVPVPAANTSSNDSGYSNNFMENESPQEGSDYNWILWVGGIIGGIWLLGSLGKK